MAVNESKLRRLWGTNKSSAEIGVELGVSGPYVRVMAKRMGLTPRRNGAKRSETALQLPKVDVPKKNVQPRQRDEGLKDWSVMTQGKGPAAEAAARNRRLNAELRRKQEEPMFEADGMVSQAVLDAPVDVKPTCDYPAPVNNEGDYCTRDACEGSAYCSRHRADMERDR